MTCKLSDITCMCLALNLVIDSFHIVTPLSNRSSIEKSIKLFWQMKGQIAY